MKQQCSKTRWVWLLLSPNLSIWIKPTTTIWNGGILSHGTDFGTNQKCLHFARQILPGQLSNWQTEPWWWWPTYNYWIVSWHLMPVDIWCQFWPQKHYMLHLLHVRKYYICNIETYRQSAYLYSSLSITCARPQSRSWSAPVLYTFLIAST